MAQTLRHTWSPTPIKAGTDRFWTPAPRRPLPLTLVRRARDARTAGEALARLTHAGIVASLGLLCGALSGGLIGVIAAHGVAVGTPLALEMVLGGAGGGALWGLIVGGFVALSTAWRSAQDGAQTAFRHRFGAARTPLARRGAPGSAASHVAAGVAMTTPRRRTAPTRPRA